MLYVHCTSKLAKAARISLQQAPEPDASHWLDYWYANLVVFNKSSSLILLTNAQSLYSVVVSQTNENIVIFEIISEFARRLENRMVSLNINAETIATITHCHAQYVACKTVSRKVLGSMNEMVFHLRWMLEEQPDTTAEALEDMLNELPSKVLGYAVPLEKFEDFLA